MFSLGYASAAYPWYGMGGSSELECLPTAPTWTNNAQTNTDSSTKMFPAKFFLGNALCLC